VLILDDLHRVEEALAEKRAARLRTRDVVLAQELEVEIDALRRTWYTTHHDGRSRRMSDDPQRDARSAHGGTLSRYEVVCLAIAEMETERAELFADANRLYQQLVEYERIAGNIPPVVPPGRQGLTKNVHLDERPRIDIGAMQTEAAARARAKATPEALERIEQQKQREKENEARVARSLPRLAPVGPVSTGNL
jgi:hypothetical protein